MPYISVCRYCCQMLRWMFTLHDFLIENNALLQLNYLFMGKKIKWIFNVSKNSWSDMRAKMSNLSPVLILLPCLPSRPQFVKIHFCTMKMCIIGYVIIHALCIFTGLYISTFYWMGDGLTTERHIGLYRQFTSNMKTQQEEKTDIFLSFSLPFFFLMSFFLSLWFFLFDFFKTDIIQ